MVSYWAVLVFPDRVNMLFLSTLKYRISQVKSEVCNYPTESKIFHRLARPLLPKYYEGCFSIDVQILLKKLDTLFIVGYAVASLARKREWFAQVPEFC